MTKAISDKEIQLESIKREWTKVLKDFKITEVYFDNNGFAGFLLDSGAKIIYDNKKKGIAIHYGDDYKPMIYN